MLIVYITEENVCEEYLRYSKCDWMWLTLWGLKINYGIFENENFWNMKKISLKYIAYGLIDDDNTLLIQVLS